MALTHDQIIAGFRCAVTSFANAEARWQQRAADGLTDQDLHDAIRYELGIAGGSSARSDRPDVAYEGSGLRIWIGNHLNPCIDPPTLDGRHTMAMARQVFGIVNPDDGQLSLF